MLDGILTPKWFIIELAYKNKLNVDEDYSISDEVNGINYRIRKIDTSRAVVEFFINKNVITINELKRMNPTIKIGQWLGFFHLENTLCVDVYYERLEEVFKSIELLSSYISSRIKESDFKLEKKELNLHSITLDEFLDLKRTRLEIKIKFLVLGISQIIPLVHIFGLHAYIVEDQFKIDSIGSIYLIYGLFTIMLLFFNPIKRVFFSSARTFRLYRRQVQYFIALCILVFIPYYTLGYIESFHIVRSVLTNPQIKKYNVVLINKCFYFVNETDSSIMICNNQPRKYKGKEVTVKEYLIQDKYRMLKVLSASK